MRFYSKFDRFFSSMLINLFYISGFIISIVFYFLVPTPYNLIILSIYIILFIFRKINLKPKLGGYLIEKATKLPLSFAVIRVYSYDLKREVLTRVADRIGKYFLLLAPGDYYLTIEKKNPDASYTLVYTSGKIRAKKGVIQKSFWV